MLKRIVDYLANLQIEEAFNLIIEQENNYKNNSTYWSLRGYLCQTINEIDTAIFCYEKSLSLNIYNTFSLNNLIYLIKNYEINKDISHYEKIIETIDSSSKNIIINSVLKDLSLENTQNNISFMNNKLFNENKNSLYLVGETLIGEDISFSLVEIDENIKNYKIIVPFNKFYLNNIKLLAEFNIDLCYVAVLENNDIHLIKIDKKILDNVRFNLRDKTIVMHYLNRSDSNVYALYKLMPKKIKNEYSVLILKDLEPYYLANRVIIPLVASLSIAGHSTFLSYPFPTLMTNIEVGHGTMTLKACGALDKMPNFAFMPWQYKNVDKLCVTSQMDLLMWMAFTSIDKDKVLISGTPRTDLLLNSAGRKNLEKLLDIPLKNKKIIFNMPTFHKHENSGRVNGNEELNDFIKIPNFNYEEFDKFLEENNAICILKVHHAEQSIISNKKTLKNFKNVYAISNEDLDKKDLDLYEIINSGDLLITDYSTIYTDFLFMNKPIIFTNYDLDDYRNNRGISLEPYDFWTAGPKVQSQKDLQKEIENSINNCNYFKEQRDMLRPIFFKNIDDKASERIWDYINNKLKK